MTILYIDQTQNNDPRIQQLLKEHGWNLSEIEKARILHNPGTPSFYNRCGKNTLTFENGFKTVPGFSMPSYDPSFDTSWAEVTDQRCVWLRKNKFDKRWIVAWSGGIDSTGILTSIIKNLPRADFENIVVACNKSSIWENPRFFFDFIKPNFTTVDSQKIIDLQTLNGANYIIDGEPADQLFSGGISQTMIISKGSLYLEKHMINEGELLIKYIAESPGKVGHPPPGLKFAEWLYHALINNIKSTNLPIETFHDALWWSYFNFSWVSIKLRMLQSGNYGTLKNAGIYFDNMIHWFDSDHYQLWAMKNNVLGMKYGHTVGEYKYQAKKYIFDFDKNRYYFKYKTKTYSGDYIWHSRKKWYCITEDLQLLNLQEHWDIIKDLLPDHMSRKDR